MDKSMTREPTTEESTKLKEYLQQGLAEMDRLFELMAQDQKEIDRLAVSSQIALAEIQATSERTDKILATLKWV